MTDPEVIGDRERYAAAGRTYRQLEPAAKLAEEWRLRARATSTARRSCSPRARTRRCATSSTASRTRLEELEEEIRLAMVERDPNDDKNVIVEIQGGAGGEEAGLWAGDVYRMLTKYAERRGFSTEAHGRRRGQVHVRDQGRRRVLASSSSRAARTACSACPPPSPRAASTPRRRPSPCCPRPRTSTSHVDQSDLQIDVYRSSGPGRPVGQHHRLGGPHHPQAERHRRLHAGREVPAAEPRARRCASCARGCTSTPLAEQQAALCGRPPLAGRHRRARGEDPHLQLRRAARDRPPHQAHPAQPRAGARGRARRASPTALQNDEKRRRLEAQAAEAADRHEPARRA